MKRIRKFILFLACYALSLNAFATAQISDSIQINGKSYALNTNPLKNHPKLDGWKSPTDSVSSTANWRGYLASWEIKDSKLLLTDITITYLNKKTDDYERRSIAGDFVDAVPAPATWYSGALIIPDGQLVNYVHMGYASTYSHYLIFQIDEGNVIGSLSLSQAEFEDYRDKKFEAFKNSEEFRQAFEETTKGENKMSAVMALKFLKEFYSETYLAK